MRRRLVTLPSKKHLLDVIYVVGNSEANCDDGGFEAADNCEAKVKEMLLLDELSDVMM